MESKNKKEITLKEVYQKLIALGTRVESESEINHGTTNRFVKYVTWILLLISLDILLTLSSIYVHIRFYVE